MRKFLKQNEKIEDLKKIIANEMNMPEDDEKVSELAIRIYVYYHGPLVRMGP